MAKGRVKGTRVINLNFVQTLTVKEARMRLGIGHTNGTEHQRHIMGILGSLCLID